MLAVSCIAWLGLGAEKARDVIDCRAPLADAPSVLTVRFPPPDLTSLARDEIPLLDVAALAGTIDDPSRSSGIERNSRLLPGHKATKLCPPLCGHAARGLVARRITSEDLAEAADRDLPQTLAITAKRGGW